MELQNLRQIQSLGIQSTSKEKVMEKEIRIMVLELLLQSLDQDFDQKWWFFKVSFIIRLLFGIPGIEISLGSQSGKLS